MQNKQKKSRKRGKLKNIESCSHKSRKLSTEMWKKSG